MELDSIKRTWQKRENPGYDSVDLVEIFEARSRTLHSQLQSYLLKDVLFALGLTSLFVFVLYFLELKSFYLWTTALVSLALVNTVLFSFQSRSLYRKMIFQTNVLDSLHSTLMALKRMRLLSIVVSTALATSLATYYVLAVSHPMSMLESTFTIIIPPVITLGMATIIYRLSLSMYINKVEALIKDMESQN